MRQTEQICLAAKIAIPLNITALMGILCGKFRDNYDTPDNHKVNTEEKFNSLINKIREDSRKKRLEHLTHSQKDDMDIGGIDDETWDEDWEEEYDEHWQYNVADDGLW